MFKSETINIIKDELLYRFKNSHSLGKKQRVFQFHHYCALEILLFSSHNLWTNMLKTILKIEVMESIIKYIECVSPKFLPFEHKQHGRNYNNYTLFILHYLEYCSKVSNDNKSETQLDLLTTSDME